MLPNNRFGKNFTIHTGKDNKREFYEHDNRASGSGSNDSHYKYPNYNNKRGGRGGARGGKAWNAHSSNWRGGRARGRGRGSGGDYYKKNEEDSHMTDLHGRNRHQEMYRGGRGSYRRNLQSSKKTVRDYTEWQKIVIKNASHLDKEKVMALIKNYVNEPFTPILYEEDKANLIFYLENHSCAAKSITLLSKRLILPDLSRATIFSVNESPPDRKLSEEQLGIVKKVMSDRYSIEMARLNLTDFHNDSQLIEKGIFCPIQKSNNMTLVVNIIVSNIPNVKDIDFSSNQLYHVTFMEKLKTCSKIQCLNFSKNKIFHLNTFEKLKGLPLKELTLEGNPLVDKYKTFDIYISAVRKIFPKLEILDNTTLPKAISFGVEEEDTTLPPSVSSFFCSPDVKDNMLQFIQQYYTYFDTNDRIPLKAAYTEDAVFSLSCSFPESGPQAKYISPYMRQNRNLRKFHKNDWNESFLVKENATIISILNDLPFTKHFPQSFKIDVTIAQSQLIHIVLCGLFEQTADKISPIRSFMRSLIVVPRGSGFCIANEQLFLTNATADQVKFIREPPVAPSTPSTSSVPAATSPPSDATSPLAGPQMEEMQIQMIQKFAEISKMLPEYCKMCLERNDWDFTKAGANFTQLQSENKIPKECFGGVGENKL